MGGLVRIEGWGGRVSKYKLRKEGSKPAAAGQVSACICMHLHALACIRIRMHSHV